VTGCVVAPCVVLVLLAGRIGRGSEVTVAALTLVADASRTVDRLALRLRNEVDPDVVSADLLAVTAGSVQPATVSLWVAR
jgi:hypothetical protein